MSALQAPTKKRETSAAGAKETFRFPRSVFTAAALTWTGARGGAALGIVGIERGSAKEKRDHLAKPDTRRRDVGEFRPTACGPRLCPFRLQVAAMNHPTEGEGELSLRRPA